MRMSRNGWALVLVILMVAIPAMAFAAPSVNPGESLAEWAYDNIAPFFPLGLAIASLWFLFRREFTGFVSFAAFALLVAVFVYFPYSVKDFAETIWNGITS